MPPAPRFAPPASAQPSKLKFSPVESTDKQKPVFSFMYLDISHKDHGTAALDDKGQVRRLFERLHGMSSMTWGEIRRNPGTHHMHAVPANKLPRANSPEYPIPQEYFQLSGSGEFRFLGFFEGDVFHVRWFDPHHRIYPFQ